jgi:hypothetical protein
MKSASGLEFKSLCNRMEILLIGYATLRFGTDTLASSGISVKDNQKSHFYVASTHGRSHISIHIRSKDGVFSLHCPYGYSKRLETERYNYQTGMSSTNLFSAKQIL